MKRISLSTILLLFITLSLYSQTIPENKKDDDNAVILINQAKEYIVKELFTLAVDNIQKAYDLNPSAFNCEDFHLMGISYYMTENYPVAIESLERSIECETNKEAQTVIYGTLADSYRKIKDYHKATLSAEKIIYLSKDDSLISGAYGILMYVYFEQGNYNKTVQSLEKTIDHYLKHLSVTEDDVMKGRVHDKYLGELYMKFAAYYNDHDNVYEAEQHIIKSALCGFDNAIDSCEKLGLKY